VDPLEELAGRCDEETMTGIGIVAVFLMIFVSVSRDEE